MCAGGGPGDGQQRNLTKLVSEGYQYIIALRKRKRSLFQPVLAENRTHLQPVEGQKNLLGFETAIPEFGEDRVIFYYNSEKVEVEVRHRKERLDKAKTKLKEIQALFLSGKRVEREKLLQQAARYLERKKLTRFFQIQTGDKKGINFTLKQEIVGFEAELDGLFVLRTDRKDLSISELVKAYKTLARAENAFKELKDFIELRSMYHWAEERVRAHIFICVLSYLIETCIEIKLVEQEIEGMKLCTYSQPSPESRRIINALGLKLPKEQLFVK